MIIHFWMHWFWITGAYFKGFLFLTAQTISFSYISHPFSAEAELFRNVTDTLVPYENVSSQPTVHPESTSSPPSHSQSLRIQTTPRAPESKVVSVSQSDSISDAAEPHNGGSLDAFQHSFKKPSKYSSLKYGKTKTKGKNDEASAEVKLLAENVNISIAIKEAQGGRLGAEIDKTNESSFEEVTSAVPTTENDGDAMTTFYPLTNETAENDGGRATTTTRTTLPPLISSKVLEEPQHKKGKWKNETLVIENKIEDGRAFTTVEPFLVKNRVAAATSAHNHEVASSEINAGSITGITLGILVVFTLFGAVSFVLYRRRYLNKPQVFHDKCSNLDSSGYIDEASLKENSEEMYSLDNDSFLNSLEAMTIQNYWTENVKHTKL